MLSIAYRPGVHVERPITAMDLSPRQAGVFRRVAPAEH